VLCFWEAEIEFVWYVEVVVQMQTVALGFGLVGREKGLSSE
jgi:hypothetical protein